MQLLNYETDSSCLCVDAFAGLFLQRFDEETPTVNVYDKHVRV